MFASPATTTSFQTGISAELSGLRVPARYQSVQSPRLLHLILAIE
ncbi:unnamed protein product, partial [Brassica oleracea]